MNYQNYQYVEDKIKKLTQDLDEINKKIKELTGKNESLTEDTVKQGNYWVNKGDEGTHGKFKTKKEADAQRKAMFANGFKGESVQLNESKNSFFEELIDMIDGVEDPREGYPRFGLRYTIDEDEENFIELINEFEWDDDRECFIGASKEDIKKLYYDKSENPDWLENFGVTGKMAEKLNDYLANQYAEKYYDKGYKESCTDECLTENDKKQKFVKKFSKELEEAHADLSGKEHTIAHALKRTMNDWAAAKTQKEAVEILTKALKDEGMDTPASRRFLMHIQRQPLNRIIETATNYMMSGMDLSMRKGTPGYDKNFRGKQEALKENDSEEEMYKKFKSGAKLKDL